MLFARRFLLMCCAGFGIACLSKAGNSDPEAADTVAAAATAPSPAPRAFPDVHLAHNSKPKYISFSADPWNKNVIYLLFDGDMDRGYNRLYVWIPDHRQYGIPRTMTGSGGRFPAVQITETHNDERSQADYRFQFELLTRTVEPKAATEARTTTSKVLDYETGKSRTVNRNIPAQPARRGRTWQEPSFSFSLNYQRDKHPFGGANRLALSVGAPVPLVDRFEQLRAPSAPWNNIDIDVSISPKPSSNMNAATLSVGAKATYAGNHRCTIESMPDGFMDVTVNINPYLRDVHPTESPTYSQTHNAIDIMRTRADISVPFGWYRASWEAKLHPWLGGRAFSGTSDLMSLSDTRPVMHGSRQPFARKDSLSADGPPASRLQGPPPSQLRGPRQ